MGRFAKIQHIFIVYNGIWNLECSQQLKDYLSQLIFNISILFITRFRKTYMLMQRSFAVTLDSLRDIAETAGYTFKYNINKYAFVNIRLKNSLRFS